MTPEEIAAEIVTRLWWKSTTDPGASGWQSAIAAALRSEREAREKAEAEMDVWREAHDVQKKHHLQAREAALREAAQTAAATRQFDAEVAILALIPKEPRDCIKVEGDA